jgi:hypothetical protein
VTAVAMASVVEATGIAVNGAIGNATVNSEDIASGSISQFHIANADLATRGSILSIRPAASAMLMHPMLRVNHSPVIFA